MQEKIQNQQFDAERALYGVRSVCVRNCTFSGPADGESALKEAQDVTVSHCHFALRYPMWHDTGLTVQNCVMTEGCRAAVWYTRDARFTACEMNGIKALRECENVTLSDCRINSPEFGWHSSKIMLKDSELTSEYAFLASSDLTMDHLTFTGKYSFQYTQNVEIHNAILHTKDAFWHARNVTVYDSEILGEYAAWYSENLRLVRCHIAGTQPFCYAKHLILEDCTMTGCDLAFENSEVDATVRGTIDSVKNPHHGRIVADGYGTVIQDENNRPDADCAILTRVPQA